MRKIVWLVIAIVAVLTPTVVLAWEPNFPSSPYTGSQNIFWPWSPTYVAEDMKWSDWNLAMWKTTGPAWLDTTADCSGGSPNGDKLSAFAFHTNIPNRGWNAKNDCGDPAYLEESELAPWPFDMVAEWPYYFDTEFTLVQGSASGEVNFTFQQWFNDPGYWDWDWLEVDGYSY